MLTNRLQTLCNRMLHVTSLIARPYYHAAKVILVNPVGDILLVKNRMGAGKWGLPGGGIERNESPVQALLREVQEELSLILDRKTELQEIGLYTRTQGLPRGTVRVFRLQLTQAQCEELRPDTHELLSAQWFAPSELPQEISETARQALTDALYF